MDPLDILPPEMWKEVFHRVAGAQDWLNLIRASPRFEELFASERQQILFPEVLPHVYKYLDTYLPRNLHVRLVCRHWKKGLDTMIAKLEVDMVNRALKYEFQEPSKLSLFLQKFEGHPCNPIIGPGVKFEYSLFRTDWQITEFRNMITEFMTRFGGQIKQLVFDYSIEDKTAASDTFLHRLRDCVQLAPNLDELIITNHHENKIRPDVVQEILNGGGVPIIPNLKSFNIQWDADNYYTNGWDAWNNVLVRLCCNPNSLTSIKMLTVPAELTTYYYHLQSASLTVARIEDAASLRNSRWPLTHLDWHNFPTPESGFDYRAMFRLIEKFRETLTSLHVRNFGTPGWVSNEDFQFRLALPHLKSLRICYFPILDFLANLTNLEELRVLMWERWRPEHDEVIQVSGFQSQRNMLCSNIWEVFPKLRKLDFTGMFREPTSRSLRATSFHNVYSREQREPPSK